MKLVTTKRKGAAVLLAAMASLGLAQAQNAVLVAYWDFNDTSDPAVAADKVLGLQGEMRNGAAYSADAEGHTQQAGDRALDLGLTSAQQMLFVQKGGFLNLAAATDQMTFTFWQKWWNPPVSSSSFWAVSPSSNDVQRGYQAHVPWGNSNIYFDSSGCCVATTQRINGNYTTFPGYYEGFFQDYHHFVFLKDGPTKRIYIDGELFLEGSNTAVLPQDFIHLAIGAQWTGGNSVQALIDDFAVFGSALSEADIAALASGTPPDQIPGVQFPADPFLLSAQPSVGPGNLPNAPINIELQDGATPIPTDSVKLYLDDALIADAQITKSGGTTTIQHTLAEVFPPSSTHTIRIEYNDGEPGTLEYDFGVVPYGILTAADKVTADTSLPGFMWNVHRQDSNTATTIDRAERQLAGLLGQNMAYATDVTIPPAVNFGTEGATPDLPISFELDTVVNMEKTGAAAGEFNLNNGFPDDLFQGVFGVQDVDFQGLAAEIITYIDLPAGLTQIIVNSDDGFQTTAGQVNDALRRQVAGQFNAGRGAADTVCLLYVEEAGVYPVRTVYFNGGGGASIEYKMIKPDGTRVLLNDTANGSAPCYRAMIGSLPAAVTRVSPAPNATLVEPNVTMEIVIEESATTINTASVKLRLDGVQVPANVSKSGKVITVTYTPDPWLKSSTTYTAELAFTEGTERTDQWQFTTKTYYPNTLVAYWPFNDASNPSETLDEIAQVPGALENGAVFTPDAGGFTGLAGDRAIDFGLDASQQLVRVSEVAFFTQASQRDQITISFWQRHEAVGVNQTAIWGVSPSSNGSMRGIGLQTPWSNNGIYYDTGGCCDAATQRINQFITAFPPYNENSANFWFEWHHIVITKNGPAKKIYIDGILFHQGNSTLPLRNDFTELLLGAEPATGDPLTHNNSMIGVMDDVAIFANELVAADIALLAAGTPPTEIADEVVGAFTSISLDGGQVVIEWQGGGTLEWAPSVGGPWTAEPGAASPYQTAPTEGMRFYRLMQ